MPRIRKSGNWYFLPFLFSFILARLSSHMSRKSYAKSISPRLTQETGYKKASGSQMTNKLMLAK